MTLKLYSCPFNHRDGRHYTIDVYAESPEDARARLRAAFYQSTNTPPQEIVLQVTVPAMLGKMIGGK